MEVATCEHCGKRTKSVKKVAPKDRCHCSKDTRPVYDAEKEARIAEYAAMAHSGEKLVYRPHLFERDWD